MTALDAFPEHGREQRDRIRLELNESAAVMRRDRLAVQAGASTIAKWDLAERIHNLGFEGDAERVFDLLPLVHVAWADGTVQKKERAAILEILRRREIQNDKAYQVMVSLLEERPSDEYLEESLAVLKDVVGDDTARAKSVVAMCCSVADKAGGLFKLFRRIPPEEMQMISRIANLLGPAARAQLKVRTI